MISETLAGTNAGVSEVPFSDTSSSNPNPLSRAGIADRAERPASGGSSSMSGGSADPSPRQGWWKRRTAELPGAGPSLVQVGGEGGLESVKTTTADVAVAATPSSI